MSASGKPEGNVLGFDFGLKHIGVAVGQTLTRQARGITTLRAKQGRPQWHEVSRLIDDYQPFCLIVGHPLHMDGGQSDMANLAEAFARQLTQKFAIPVQLADERLTSFAAQDLLEDAKARGLGANDHEVAACLITEQFLSEN